MIELWDLLKRNRRYSESNFFMGKELVDFMEYGYYVIEVCLNYRWFDKDLMVIRILKL